MFVRTFPVPPQSRFQSQSLFYSLPLLFFRHRHFPLFTEHSPPPFSHFFNAFGAVLSAATCRVYPLTFSSGGYHVLAPPSSLSSFNVYCRRLFLRTADRYQLRSYAVHSPRAGLRCYPCLSLPRSGRCFFAPGSISIVAKIFLSFGLNLRTFADSPHVTTLFSDSRRLRPPAAVLS